MLRNSEIVNQQVPLLPGTGSAPTRFSGSACLTRWNGAHQAQGSSARPPPPPLPGKQHA